MILNSNFFIYNKETLLETAENVKNITKPVFDTSNC